MILPAAMIPKVSKIKYREIIFLKIGMFFNKMCFLIILLN